MFRGSFFTLGFRRLNFINLLANLILLFNCNIYTQNTPGNSKGMFCKPSDTYINPSLGFTSKAGAYARLG